MIRFSLIAIILFFSCSQKTKVPDAILPPDKMEKLLMDMLRADEIFNRRQVDSTLGLPLDRMTLYNSVLASHKTDEKTFKKSFTYYENRPDLLKTVLDSMYSQSHRNRDTIKQLPPKLKKPLKQ